MRTLVIGLAGADPDLLLGDDRLENFRRLMAAGSYGRLESVIPPVAVPAWSCLATGHDPGTLGVYGARDRADRSYDAPVPVDLRSTAEPTIWDLVARQGGKPVIVAAPPETPPRTLDKARLRDEVVAISRKHFAAVRHSLATAGWDYLQFVEVGLDRIQNSFWSDHDPRHVQHDPASPHRDAVRDYYRHLDDELGRLLELLDDETIVLVASDHGARPLEGGFCLDEWLVREGLLVLNRTPAEVTPTGRLDVDWGKTRAWGVGGHVARIYINVKGREPDGVVDPADYERFRDDLKARLEALTDPDGRPLGTLVFKPEEVYRAVRNVAPDLIVHLGGLAWKSVGGVGHPSLHVRAGECNNSQHGVFILAAPDGPVQGAIEGAHILDIAPTLLDLVGLDRPSSMRGRSLALGSGEVLATDDDLIRERLSGLGYL
jgi:predicted AlkP superfamily phosphohydrolase/phosphomutase